MTALSHIASEGTNLTPDQIRAFIAKSCPPDEFRGKKVLLIVPDSTRTCPLDAMFAGVFDQIGGATAALDVMIALGTHQPMSEEAICERLGITLDQRRSKYASVQLLNHAWDNPAALRKIGTITVEKSRELTGGMLAEEVPVEVNAQVFNYDLLFIVGPVFPHEVIGFSGGNKYLFPGVSGPTALNYFHWLGALVTNPMIIGNKWTPVRKVVDYIATLVTVPKRCLCMVVTPGDPAQGGGGLAALTHGDPVSAWDAASEVSRRVHITYKDRPFHTILSCAPKMYDDMWVGGKCMYKLEPVIADGGELIIYAPHITELSVTHGHHIHEIGYHCLEYFTADLTRFSKFPRGVISHSTHVRGIGKMEDGVEQCRVNVSFATGISEEVCKAIGVGYRDWRGIKKEDYANREDQGVMLVPKAGEMLFHLKQRPSWAREM